MGIPDLNNINIEEELYWDYGSSYEFKSQVKLRRALRSMDAFAPDFIA